VRQGAVVVARQGNENKQLVAFYSGQRVEPDNLRDWLSQSLPEYMIPAAFHWRETLPLTANGKVDRKSLAALTLAMDSAGKSESATTPAEIRLADAWSEVLGIPRQQIRRRDHFFDRGGTSLSAVKLVIALKSAVSLKEVIGQPVLAELAIVLERKLLKQPELISSQSRANGDSHHVA
jgi:hypothetical protein